MKEPDFKAVGLGDYTHITQVEMKGPIGSDIEMNNCSDSNLVLQGEKIGSKISKQQVNWSNPEYSKNKTKFPNIDMTASFLKSPNNVLRGVDEFDVP